MMNNMNMNYEGPLCLITSQLDYTMLFEINIILFTSLILWMVNYVIKIYTNIITCYPKNPCTLQWKGLNPYSRGSGPQK